MMKDSAFVRNGGRGFHYSPITQMWDQETALKTAEGWMNRARLCRVPAGALLLWNSRTVHTGWKSGPRLAQTVCLEPAARRPRNEQLAKMRLAALGLPSTHWPSHGMQHDMTLYSDGVFAEDDPPQKYAGEVEHSKVRLPLKATLKPAALKDDADLDALRELLRVKFQYTGMWVPTEGAEDILEGAIKDEFKQFL